MTKKTPIKIIKREDRTRQQTESEKPQNARKSAQETAREMVGTVTNWVNEFQQKRRTETSRAIQNIQNLFPEPAAQPNEA
jgi:uncharacterized membrane-anchored protein